MKIQGVSNILVPNTSMEDLPIMDVKEIQSILSLGIRGNIRPETEDTGAKNTVDMLA